MNERTWQKSANPRQMLEYLGRWASERKRRLLTCACCRRRWALLTDERSRRAVETVELHAVGLATEEAMYGLLYPSGNGMPGRARAVPGLGLGHGIVVEVLQSAIHPRKLPRMLHMLQVRRNIDANAERAAQCDLIRELFGNPYRPKGIYPEWRPKHDGALVRLAESMYRDVRFDDLPILADALEDAGCGNADMLAHCRAGGDHVRGCWVVDLVLGMS
jgi:hypothetical protein